MRDDFLYSMNIMKEYLNQDNLFKFNKTEGDIHLLISPDSTKLNMILNNKEYQHLVIAYIEKSKKAPDNVIHFLNMDVIKNIALIEVNNSYKYMELESKKTINLGIEYDFLKNIKVYFPLMNKLVKLLKNDDKEQITEHHDFYKHITKNNIKKYIELIELNIDKKEDFIEYIKESQKLNFNIFKLSSEEKEIIQLHTDLKYDFKTNDSLSNKLMEKIKKMFRNK